MPGFSTIYRLPAGIKFPKSCSSSESRARYVIAKCPKISKLGNAATAREALGKLVTELEITLKYYRYSGVQRIFGIELVQAWPFLVSRKRKGTLADLIAEPRGWGINDKVMSLVQVAHTLNYCRRLGLIAHQDLKPDNIFFDDPFEKFAINRNEYTGLAHEMYVGDFGIADAFRDIGHNSGSRPYMAPEQYEQGLIDGSKIDVFALGVITFECLMDGLHPIGERTVDVWPTKLPDKPSKWGHEDVWKRWSRQDKSGYYENVTKICCPHYAL